MSAGQVGVICLLLLAIVALLEAVLAQMRNNARMVDRYRGGATALLFIAVAVAAYTGLKP